MKWHHDYDENWEDDDRQSDVEGKMRSIVADSSTRRILHVPRQVRNENKERGKHSEEARNML